MVLGITEDFTCDVTLDSQLLNIPSSGLYINSGVHPSVNLENLLYFLPNINFTFADWDNTKTYNDFLSSRNKGDIVMHNEKIYQSIANDNVGNEPNGDDDYWVETNIESLRLKIFIESVKDRVYSDLSLTRRLVNNQYIYEKAGNYHSTQLPNDYAAWVIEPKGSDYVAIKINEIAIQKDGTDPINVYFVNEGRILDIKYIEPDYARLTFNKVDFSFYGKGPLIIAIDSTDVYVKGNTIDPLRFDGFVAYTATGIGDSPDSADYYSSVYGNGIGLNVSAYLDASKYIDNNLSELGTYVRSTFEYMAFQMFLHNSNNRSNRKERIQLNDDLLIAELKDTRTDTVVSRYHKERKRAINAMKKTFDTQLNDHDGLEVTIGSV